MKVIVMLLLLGLMIAPAVIAADTLPTPGDMLGNVWEGIKYVAEMRWVTSGVMLIGFLRLVICLTIFVVIFELTNLINLGRGARFMISAMLAIMTGIFFPASLMIQIGGLYAAIVITIFVALAIAAFFWLWWACANWIPNPVLGWGFRLLIALVGAWIFYSVGAHAADMINAGVDNMPSVLNEVKMPWETWKFW